MKAILRAWLSKITPQDAVGMIWGACGTAVAAGIWIYSFGIQTADARNGEIEQDRRITALEQQRAADTVATSKELRAINANLVRLMVSTGVQPVERAE